MRAAGVDIVTDYSEVSVVGITEILSHLPSLISRHASPRREAERRKPAFAILTDFPGFHLRSPQTQGPWHKNIYYICPQFWAWRPWRVRVVRRRFAQALCIFPFEEKFYADAGVPVKFIGHPLVGAVHASLDRQAFCREQGLDPQKNLVTILPGSRAAELRQHLPVLREACLIIHRESPAQFVLAAAREAMSPLCEGLAPGNSRSRCSRPNLQRLGRCRRRHRLQWHRHHRSRLLDVPWSSSTSSRLSPRSSPSPRAHILLQHGQSNRRQARRTELIQNDFTPARVGAEVLRLLNDQSARASLRQDLAEVRQRLGPPGAVERAADAILQLLGAEHA